MYCQHYSNSLDKAVTHLLAVRIGIYTISFEGKYIAIHPGSPNLALRFDNYLHCKLSDKSKCHTIQLLLVSVRGIILKVIELIRLWL